MSMAPAQLTDLLSRYALIEQQIANLHEQREALRAEIKACVVSSGQDTWRVPLSQHAYKVNVLRRENVSYREDVLRERLGEKYPLILEPDARKLRQNLDCLQPVLHPFLELIGSPSRERVRESIHSGQLAVHDFQGAFEKTFTETLYISRQQS